MTINIKPPAISQKRGFTPLDAVIVFAVLALIGYVLFRLSFALNYKWNWSVIVDYLFLYDDQGLRSGVLLHGFYTTIRLSIWGTLLAAVLGIFFGILSISRKLLFRLITRAYVELIRNIPALVLVFIFYFFVSDQIMPLLNIDQLNESLSKRWLTLFSFLFSPPELSSQFISGVITLGLFQGAYITEIVRAGIQSIDTGQWEASKAIGLNKYQQMRCVIFPQAIRRMLPPLGNEFINTIKYSSIVSVISIQELTFQGMQVMASTQVTIEVWLTITAMYLALCLALSMGVGFLEQRLSSHG